ncbi:transcriptional regulator [Desmospora sp. 8437]|nr:transcriptional regulator [Desmospora sp. 8437]
MGFTWSDFGSSEQRKRHVKPHPDRLGPEIYQKPLVDSTVGGGYRISPAEEKLFASAN